MSSCPKRLCQSIQNTLRLLTDNDLTIYYNQPVIQETHQRVRITWPNHVTGKHNSASSFGKISQYRAIIETGAFTCLLLDGAILRASYSFDSNELTEYNLLWWPSPFIIDAEDLKIGAVLDIFDLYADSNEWHKDIKMRTPIRFDLDINNASKDHPASHVHFQESNCRLHVDRPICFNRFIKFIFKNFYPNIYSRCFFWKDLQDMSFDVEAVSLIEQPQSYLGWGDKMR